MFRTPVKGAPRPTSIAAALAGEQAEWIEALWGDAGALLRVDDVRRQLWFAVGAQLALRPERVRPPVPAAQLARWLETTGGVSLLQAAGLGAPFGWRAALARLGPFALSEPQRYLELFELLAEGGSGANILRHAEPLTAELIGVLAALESELRQARLVRALLEEGGAPEVVARRWMWRLTRLRDLAPEAAVAVETSVRAGATPTDPLDTDGAGWLAPFPPPPWEGTAKLRPLDTPAALHGAADRFRNCLTTRLACVRARQAFFYEWTEEPRMVAELEFDPPYGWCLGEVRLAGNASPSVEQVALVVEELSGARNVFAGSIQSSRPLYRGRGRAR